MTAILRSNKYLQFFIPENFEGVNDYFKDVKAQNWKLKHYLNYRLENEEEILTWTEIYKDWKDSLEIITKNNYKNVPGCICSFCKDLLDIDTFEGSSVLRGCIEWYNDLYDRRFDLKFADRIQLLETTIFSSQKISELLRTSSKNRRLQGDNEAGPSEKRSRRDKNDQENEETEDIPEMVQKKQRPDDEKGILTPRKKVNCVDASSPDKSENDSIFQENGNGYNEGSYLQQQTLNEFSPLSILKQYCTKKNTSPYDPAHSFILDLSPTSKIRNEFSHEQWFELSKRPDAVKKTSHHEIEPFIVHLFQNNMDLSQARLKWDELQKVDTPEYKNELSYNRDEWKKIRWWIHRVVGQFLDAFESFRNPLENYCNERQWTGNYIIPLIEGILKLNGRCLVPWGEVAVLATQHRRNNDKDINIEKVTRSHLADFLCRYERNEIVCGLICGGPHAYDLTKYASDQFNLPRMMKDMLDDLLLKFYYANHKLYTIGIQVYMTEIQVYMMEKREIYFFHHLKSFDLPISFSSYNSLKYALRTMWNIRGLVNSLIQEFDIILDDNDGFRTPPLRVLYDMKTQITPPKQPKKK
ncbi:hypothetical protein Glove_150g88 [Diversispora epigaea]|uniref:Uncharacterized protein n=1 Tax=Diversispora epigaea TaxID=1348612 RepID=A0A397ITE1_9GLOM|nr:hypothetical protein Glove_150g88 [Diversispora epigaea]